MKKIAIIGGGLAGTACAYVLKCAGVEPVIYEAGAEIAPGASGNPIGLYNPRLSAHRTPESDFYAHAFRLALETFSSLCHSERLALKNLDPSARALQDDNIIDWNPCGALHLITDERKKKQLEQTIETWGWAEKDIQLLDAEQTSEIAGVELRHEAIYLPGSGYVSPKKLCERYADGVEVHFNTKIKSIADVDADAVVLACGMGVRKFEETRELPLSPVRGQVTFVKATAESEKLRCALCYDGYVLPVKDGGHIIGATFQQGVRHSDIHEDDDRDNIAALAGVAPDVAKGLKPGGSWASVRVTSKDHFPVIGRAHDCRDVYVSTAHSAHGIIGSLAGAHLIADMILERELSLPDEVVKKLNPVRFGV